MTFSSAEHCFALLFSNLLLQAPRQSAAIRHARTHLQNHEEHRTGIVVVFALFQDHARSRAVRSRAVRSRAVRSRAVRSSATSMAQQRSMGSGGGNLLVQAKSRLQDVDAKVKLWLKKQPAAVEVSVVTAGSAVQGGAIGAVMGSFTQDMAKGLPSTSGGMNPQAAASLQQAKALTGGPLLQARNFAVMTGVNAGITCAMKRFRGGVEDIQTSMVAAFGSGAVFSVVSGMGGPNVAGNAVVTGTFFALLQGGIYKLGSKFAQPPVEDKLYSQGRKLLSELGLQKYEKNFKKGLLTDSTLPLLNDSALKEVRIPPGPRLLILDQVKR